MLFCFRGNPSNNIATALCKVLLIKINENTKLNLLHGKLLFTHLWTSSVKTLTCVCGLGFLSKLGSPSREDVWNFLSFPCRMSPYIPLSHPILARVHILSIVGFIIFLHIGEGDATYIVWGAYLHVVSMRIPSRLTLWFIWLLWRSDIDTGCNIHLGIA